MARLQDKRSFMGINFDDADEYLQEGDTRSMLNVRVGYSESGNDGIVTNVKGTKNLFSELNFSLPTGTNRCVATCTDDQNNRLIWFNYNQASSHGIYAYNNDENTIDTILETPTLSFSGDIIHSVDILDNNLAWTDNINRPRAINVTKALAGVLGAVTLEELINDAKAVPMLPPVCTTTITYGTDYIKSLKSFQFIYRYVFIDGEKGAWSTVSDLVSTGYKDEHISKITLDVSGSEIFTKTQLRRVIEFVEFASRESYTLNFNQFLRIPTADLVTAAGIVDYYDTESKTTLTTTETNIAFYENPIKAGSVCFQNDRKFYSDCTEGYDAFDLTPSLSNVNVQVIPASGGIPYLSDCSTHVNDRYLKPDSEYNYSVEFHDKYGRKSGAIDLPELVIKTQEQLSNDYKANVLQFGLNLAAAGSYPSWAEKFEIIRSDNKSVTYFVQGRANRVLYCTGYDSSGDPVYIADANATTQNVSDTNAIELHIDIANWTQFGTNISYTFTEGDRITFLTMGGILDSSSVPALKSLKIKELLGSLLVVEYPQIGRVTLNHANLTNTDYSFGIFTFGVLSRFMVGDNGVALYSRINRVLTPDPLTYPFSFSDVALMVGFPSISNHLYGISVIYGDPVGATNVDIYIVGSGGYFIKGSFNPEGNVFGTWTTLTTGVSVDINAIESSFTYHNKPDLIMVGDNGTIIKYIRASDTFVQQTSGTTENLNYVYREFTTDDLIAVGDNGTILKTTDNGDTWTQVEIDFCQKLNGVYFRDDAAIVVGDEGLVLFSSDRGVTWVHKPISTVYNLNSVEGDGTLVTARAYIAGDNGYFSQFNLDTGLLISAYNTGTTKNINFFQSYWTTVSYYDLGIGVGSYDLLLDVSVPLLTFTSYSSYVETLYGSFYLNYRAKIEVFTPKTTAGPTIFYETGDAHLVGQNYTFNKGKENDGDVFLIAKDFRGDDWTAPGEIIFSMTPNSNDTTGTWDKDLGRPNVVLLYPEKQQRRNIIRPSEKYVQDSKINGLSNFNDVYEPIPNEFGWVRKITPVESILLINAEREAATAYIDQTIFKGSDGRDVAAVSDQIINNVRKLTGGFGCTSPESIVSYLGYVYWDSSNKAAVCRYNNSNGVFPISEYKARTYFYGLRDQLNYLTKINGGYEPKFKNYLLSIINKDISQIEVIAESTDSSEPLSGTLNPLTGDVYYPLVTGGALMPIIKTDGTIRATISIGQNPTNTVYDPLHKTMYVGSRTDNNVKVIDVDPSSGTYNTVISTISVDTNPVCLLYDLSSQNVYVADSSTDTIKTISTNTNTVIATISVGNISVSLNNILVVDTDNKNLFVCNSSTNSVSVIDINPLSGTYNTVTDTVTTGTNPGMPLYNDTLGVVYTFNSGSSTISVINTTTFAVTTIAMGSVSIQGTLYNDSRLYVSDRLNARVRVVDCNTNTIVQDIAVSVGPYGGVIDTINNLLIVPSNDSGPETSAIDFIDLSNNEVVKTITLASGSADDITNIPVFNPVNGLTFVTGQNYTFNILSTGDYIDKQTIAFQEGSNRWISKYSFWPEMYGCVSNEMFSFLNGTMWKHNSTAVYNNFHGTQYTSQVRPVFNAESSIQKNFTAISLEADKVWAASSITTPEGQESFILSGHFEKINNEWWADVKQDINTPNMASTDEALFNGDYMQSNVLEVLFETTASDAAKLNSTTLFSNVNHRTGR
jgi:DNA-binding beta-propeller fold protein YncE